MNTETFVGDGWTATTTTYHSSDLNINNSICDQPLKLWQCHAKGIFNNQWLLWLWKSRAWEIPEAEQSYTEACQKDFRDHGNATVEGQDLASTYVLHPHLRIGCPDFKMGWKGVMGRSVMEQGVMEQGVMEQGVMEWRCDGAESRVLG